MYYFWTQIKMPSNVSSTFSRFAILLIICLPLTSSIDFNYPAVFNFGDSNSDTGNLVAGIGAKLNPPYGQNYFQKPSGRFCDGRLIIDFLMDAMDFPFLNAYLKAKGTPFFRKGCNFAAAGSTILPATASSVSPFSFGIQVAQFLRFKAKVRELQSKCQNDIAGGFYSKTLDQILDSIPIILSQFEDGIAILYDQGARNFWIHNTGPLGCLPENIVKFGTDPSKLDGLGCVSSHNQASKKYNLQLHALCKKLQGQYQDANVTYVDIFTIKSKLIANYSRYGFEQPLMACCGYGGPPAPPLNYDSRIACGQTKVLNESSVTAEGCNDSTKYVIWDGIHYTEAANLYKLYEQGVRNFWIHNIGPLGCLPQIISMFGTNSSTLDGLGCVDSHNQVSKKYNLQLHALFKKLQGKYQDANVTYVDIFTIKSNLIANYSTYGFYQPLMACCGYGGPPLNYDSRIACGQSIVMDGSLVTAKGLNDSTKYVNWDGSHYTEAANQHVASEINIQLNMASNVSSTFSRLAILFMIICLPLTSSIDFNYPAVFNFGDSNSDTGNLVAGLGVELNLPNGQTYFHKPSGRFCDGRLIIDFLMDAFDLPFLSPYLESIGAPSFRTGSNFAVWASTVLSASASSVNPFSFEVQVAQFLRFKAKVQDLHDNSGKFDKYIPDQDYFQKALYMFDIGQNDLADGFLSKTLDQVLAAIPIILSKFEDGIEKLYEQGAKKFWIHNTGPLGCLPENIVKYGTDPSKLDGLGCVRSQNQASKIFNLQLHALFKKLQGKYQDANVTYVDIFTIKSNLIANYSKYGFEQPLMACCGYGGPPSNYDSRIDCGQTKVLNGSSVTAKVCDDSTKYINWEGTHYTEAANQYVASEILTGKYSDPPFSDKNTRCLFL
ncbi:hypothetical protein ACJIZ3_014817 [Penstemon smallii]|uniref:GDSL esterase/lipase n=1 Tax=Penstemon smallii TaxID=265156 RepID=A0ABD3RKN3_9LAMI